MSTRNGGRPPRTAAPRTPRRARALGAVAALLIYAACVFGAAGALALPVFAGLTWAGVEGLALHELSADLLKVLALLGLWPLLTLRAGASRAAFGLRCPGRGWLELRRALVLGLVSMAVLAALLLLLDVRVGRPEMSAHAIPRIAMKALLVAVPVALLEEIWFRGALTRVAAPLGPRVGLTLVASLYAAVHFIRPDQVVHAPHAWSDGFVAVAGMFGRFSDPGNLDAFVALLMAGLVLGQLRRATGCVAACVGLHAGWVFIIQMLRRSTQVDPQAGSGWLVSRYDGTIGWGFAVLALVLLVILVRGAARPPPGAVPLGGHRA